MCRTTYRGGRHHGQRQADRRYLRREVRRRPYTAHIHNRLSHRDVASEQASPRQSVAHRAFRAFRGRQGGVQRLLRAQRPHRPAGAFSGAVASVAERRRRGHVHRYGLRACPRIRHASLFRYGHRHRPPDYVHDRSAVYTGCVALPADASREKGQA